MDENIKRKNEKKEKRKKKKKKKKTNEGAKIRQNTVLPPFKKRFHQFCSVVAALGFRLDSFRLVSIPPQYDHTSK